MRLEANLGEPMKLSDPTITHGNVFIVDPFVQDAPGLQGNARAVHCEDGIVLVPEDVWNLRYRQARQWEALDATAPEPGG